MTLTARIAGITLILTEGLTGVSASMTGIIGDGSWTRECKKIIEGLSPGQPPLFTHFGGGEDLKELGYAVSNCLEQGETFKRNTLAIPMPRDPGQWTIETFARIIEVIRRHAERFGVIGHVGTITLIFPLGTNRRILADFAALANQR